MTCAENQVLNKEDNGWDVQPCGVCAAVWAGALDLMENGRGLGDPSSEQSAQQQCPEGLVGAVNGRGRTERFPEETKLLSKSVSLNRLDLLTPSTLGPKGNFPLGSHGCEVGWERVRWKRTH